TEDRVQADDRGPVRCRQLALLGVLQKLVQAAGQIWGARLRPVSAAAVELGEQPGAQPGAEPAAAGPTGRARGAPDHPGGRTAPDTATDRTSGGAEAGEPVFQGSSDLGERQEER